MTREIIPKGRAIWQSDSAKTYRCPSCASPVFTQYEGEASPVTIDCNDTEHVVEWHTPSAGQPLSFHRTTNKDGILTETIVKKPRKRKRRKVTR